VHRNHFGVSSIVQIIITGFAVGLAMVLRELTEDMQNAKTRIMNGKANEDRCNRAPIVTTTNILMRAVTKVAGACLAAWLAAALAQGAGLEQWEWAAAGVASLFGWRILDGVQIVFDLVTPLQRCHACVRRSAPTMGLPGQLMSPEPTLVAQSARHRGDTAERCHQSDGFRGHAAPMQPLNAYVWPLDILPR